MKRMAALSLMIVGIGFSVLAQDPPAPTSNPYFPMKVGNVWRYKVQGGPITVEIKGTEKVKDTTAYKFETKAGEKVSATETVGITKDGVVRFNVNGLSPEVPILFLKADAKAGDSWTVDTKVSGQVIKGTFTAKTEKVTVPKGTYDALHVKGNDMEIGSTKTTVEYWFAKDVGIVKLKFSLGSQEAVLELEEFTSGK